MTNLDLYNNFIQKYYMDLNYSKLEMKDYTSPKGVRNTTKVVLSKIDLNYSKLKKGDIV